MSDLTSQEWRLVEKWTGVLDYVSRVDLALSTKDWFYLLDKSGELARVAERLHKVADDIWRDIDGGGDQPRMDRVNAEILRVAGHYRAGRALYGLDKPPSPLDGLIELIPRPGNGGRTDEQG